MVMATTTDRPIRLADMTREEAETVTDQIKENFDSLGNMLIAARDRKAFRVLGYRSFETYCQTEFGKSSSTAYQAIEDAKIRSQLEARISEEYGESITLIFPASHLRPLKEIDNIDDKLKAIEYANKLAAAENRKATKKDLEIAVFHFSGKRSEDFRAAIQGLGFSRGVQVEVIKSLKRDRGWVTKVDKAGKIYVEFHYGSIVAIPYDAADLRILSEDEYPAKQSNEDITNKGDRVSIFSPGLKGKEGTIFQWKSGKQALVIVDGLNSPIDIAYAEMELVKVEEKNANWKSELVWESGKNTYYYFPREDKIYSSKWPAGLTLEPHTHESSPIDFMVNWEDKFAGELLEGLTTTTNLKTLVLAQAIELPEAEGKEFVADLIVSLLQLFPQTIPESSSTLAEENQRLLIQPAESETVIQSTIAASTDPLEPEQTADFSLKNTSDNPTPGESATQPELPPELASQIDSIRNKFLSLIENYEKTKKVATKKKEIDNLNDNIDTLQKKLENLKNFEQFRIGNTICHQRRVTILGKITGLEFTQDEMPIVWVKYYEEGKLQNTASTEIVRMIFVVEDAATTDSPTTKNLDQDNDAIIAAKRERIEKDLEALTQNLLQTSNEKKIKKIRADIRIQESRREDIDNFTTLEIGDSVIRKIYPDRKGIIDKLEISTTGLLTVWVVWPQKYEGEPNSPEEHNVGTLTKIADIDDGEQ